MIETTPKKLTMEAFGKYGTFADMLRPKPPVIGERPIEFYRDMLQLDLGGKSIASFSICRVEKRRNVVDVTEYHSSCGEGCLPLDGDVLVHVGIATPSAPPLKEIEVFIVPKGTMLVLRPGVWHHAPFAINAAPVNVLIVLPERTYANDCTVVELNKSKAVSFGR